MSMLLLCIWKTLYFSDGIESSTPSCQKKTSKYWIDESFVLNFQKKKKIVFYFSPSFFKIVLSFTKFRAKPPRKASFGLHHMESLNVAAWRAVKCPLITTNQKKNFWSDGVEKMENWLFESKKSRKLLFFSNNPPSGISGVQSDTVSSVATANLPKKKIGNFKKCKECARI